MFNELKTKASCLKSKVVAVPVAASTALLMATNCFAADEVATSMTSAMTAVKTDMLSVISVVAPIGIAIAGVILVWRRGIGFFKSISK